jgi:hypothetical protein
VRAAAFAHAMRLTLARAEAAGGCRRYSTLSTTRAYRSGCRLRMMPPHRVMCCTSRCSIRQAAGAARRRRNPPPLVRGVARRRGRWRRRRVGGGHEELRKFRLRLVAGACEARAVCHYIHCHLRRKCLGTP